MGYERVTTEIYGTLSRHNAPKDIEHNKLWNDMMRRINLVVFDPKYKSISPDWFLSFQPEER